MYWGVHVPSRVEESSECRRIAISHRGTLARKGNSHCKYSEEADITHGIGPGKGRKDFVLTPKKGEE